ncbi:MAG: universal stress protein [Sphingopyxis sp.]|nr:universal stress protein [Sphingopyxis sp.]
MSVRSILLFAPAETADPARGPAAYAIALAKAEGARLSIFTVAVDVTTPGRSSDAAGVAAALTAAASAAGVEHRLITDHAHNIGVHEAVAAEARLHDLSVTGCSGQGLLSERIVAEHLLFETGRPLIVVPASHAGGGTVGKLVAAWDHSRAASRALGDAILLFGSAAVQLVAVEGEKALASPLSAADEQAALAARGLDPIAVRPLGGRTIAAALQGEAATLGADLLVMGGFGHSRMRSYVLGSATTGLFAELTLPTLLSH